MLTNAILRQLATSTTYSRGEGYFYNENVRRIKRTGDTFTAKVSGSENYYVTLTLSPSGPEFSCSCPYYYEGICKHEVALGLAVLDEFGPVLEASAPSAAANSATPHVSAETLWQVATTDQKLNFLRQLLDKQPDLREQLSGFIGFRREAAVAPELTKTSSADIEKICTDVYKALSKIRFDESTLIDYDDHYNDPYSEEGPDPAPPVKEVLQPYADKVIKALREGRLTEAMPVYLGVYEGTQTATEAKDDEFSVVDDYPELSWGVWNELLTDAYAQLATRVLHPDQIRLALQLVADRVTVFDHADDAPNEADDESDEEFCLYANLRMMEPLLLAIVTDAPSARAVQEAINQHKWTGRGTEYILLRIADTLDDPDTWIERADQFADDDSKIAEQLLERRRKSGDLPALLTDLHRFTKRFPNVFNAFVVEHLDDKKLTPGPDLDLFLTALEAHCRAQGKLADYLRLRAYWTETQRNTFANCLNPRTGGSYMAHPLFYAQVLHTENRSNELLIWLKGLDWQYSHQLPNILPILAETHPADCMQLVAQKSIDLLETGKKGRTLYGSIAGWLAALNNVPVTKPAVTVLVSRLLGNYNRLSALRDEFRMKGLTR